MRVVTVLLLLGVAAALDAPRVLSRRDPKEMAAYFGMLGFAAWMAMGAALGWPVPHLARWLDRVFDPVFGFIHHVVLRG